MIARFVICAAIACAGAGAVENNAAARLARVRRIYVEPLQGGAVSVHLRDMLIAALENSGYYSLTDEPDRADAMLRGSADEQVFTEQHNTSESIGITTRAGGGSGSRTQSGATTSGAGLGVGLSQRESSRIQEHRREASASVRLVDAEGDVIWSTTQESSGGKFRGAMADVADKIARNLIDQTRRARSAH